VLYVFLAFGWERELSGDKAHVHVRT
jgi:hypothetical protein